MDIKIESCATFGRSRSPVRRSRSRSRSPRDWKRERGGSKRDRDDGERPVVNSKRVYVSNIPYEIRWQDLKDLFKNEGKILQTVQNEKWVGVE